MASWSLSSFLACERGTAALEFVVALPLSIGLAVMAAEYGNGLMTREALDSALGDATRVLSRAPLDAVGDPETGAPTPKIYTAFLNEARGLIASRTGVPVEAVGFTAEAVVVPGTESFRTPIIMIETRASVGVDLRLLSFIDNWLDGGEVAKALTMRAIDRARYVGELAPGQRACPASERDAGRCGGAA